MSIEKRIRIVGDNAYSLDRTGFNDIVTITYRASSRYGLGTKGVSDEEAKEINGQLARDEIVGGKVFAYIHSGSTIRFCEANPFGCPFDSGQSGVAFVSRETAIREWGRKRLTSKVREKAMQYIQGVVEEFDCVLRGEVYGFVVEALVNGEYEQSDSCWGFFGNDWAKNGLIGNVQTYLDKGYVLCDEGGEPLTFLAGSVAA